MAYKIDIDTATARFLLDKKNLDLVIAVAAQVGAEQIVENISHTSGSGKAYKTRGRVHIASSPGQYPTKETGELARSVDVRMGINSSQADIVISSPYALDLEYGTSKMRPRPFINRSINELSKTFPKILDRLSYYINSNNVEKVTPMLKEEISSSESRMSIAEARSIIEGLIEGRRSSSTSRSDSVPTTRR